MYKLSLVFSFILLFITETLIAATPTANGEAIRHVKTSEKVVALSFDDGPSVPYTEEILSVLRKHNVKATFYVIGQNAKEYPNLIKKIMAEGHDLGNHTMYHHPMKKQTVQNMVQEIQSVDTVLRNLGYQGEITFRAPYGVTSPNLKEALKELNKRMVLFEFLAQDWTKISSQQIYDNVMVQLKPGLIITLHDGGKSRQHTVEATEMLIENIQKKGYRFAPMSELLKL